MFKFFNKNKNTPPNRENFLNSNKPNIRLVFVHLSPFTAHDGTKKIGETYGVSSKFSIPKNTTLEDACKIISYLSETIEKKENLTAGWQESVIKTSQKLQDFGFNKIENTKIGYIHAVSKYTQHLEINDIIPEETDTLDLFTISGNLSLFENSDISKRYFNWFTEGITTSDVTEIYKKLDKSQNLDL